MTVELQTQADARTMTARLSGKLSKEDYSAFVPEVERLIQQRGKIRLLVVMHDFHGWDAGALWEDVKFDLKHFNDVERIAFVGEKKWHKGMALFCKPFTTAKVGYFEHDRIEDARRWLQQESPAS